MIKYNEIMKNIEVTPEMRTKILDNIYKKTAPRKEPFFIRYRAWFAAAACLTIFVIGGIMLLKTVDTPTEPPSSVLIRPDFAECADISELSEKIGFEVKEPQNLPFEYDDVSYTVLWGEIAEIAWTNNGEQAGCFRTALGSEDISGDYTSYPEIAALKTGGTNITVKGDNGKYSAAVWTDDKFSYSLNLIAPVSAEQLAAVIETIV